MEKWKNMMYTIITYTKEENAMVKLQTKGKVLVLAVVFAAIAAAGCVIERLEKDMFITETVATEDRLFGNSENSGGGVQPDGKIDINAASEEELSSLYGIGEKLAQRIVRYREENGPYEVIEDIMKVPGIDEGKYNGLKDDICVR